MKQFLCPIFPLELSTLNFSEILAFGRLKKIYDSVDFPAFFLLGWDLYNLLKFSISDSRSPCRIHGFWKKVGMPIYFFLCLALDIHAIIASWIVSIWALFSIFLCHVENMSQACNETGCFSEPRSLCLWPDSTRWNHLNATLNNSLMCLCFVTL